MTTARRSLLKGAAALAALSAVPLPALAQPFLFSPTSELMPKGKKRRVVVLGGGWGGLSTAKHLRQTAPDLEVVLVEKNPIFWSCPLSNKWLIDVVDTQFLVHSYTGPARRWGYTYIQTEITDIDRDKKRVHTAQGHLDYDWLVVSAGIRVSYEPWFGNDRKAISHTLTHYSSAYVPSAEHLALKQKIKSFKGGTFVMTLPPPPHRCPPSPYERACLIAAYFQRNKIPAKILILDPKPRIAPIGAGYKLAFEDLYDDIITHVPNARVKELDPFNRVVKTTAGDFKFDDAIFMGHHQAADLVWKMGAIGKTPDGKPSTWAAVHPEYYNLKDDPNVFVIGDSVGAVSPQFGHYPKSGHVANRMGRSVAQYIAQQAKEQAMKPVIIDNLCYMLVNTEPLEAISVQFDYKMGPEGHLIQTQVDDHERRKQLWEEDLRWYATMIEDFAAG
ncbi:NAD(P)/FAD-dependent oxidoreductase [Lacisediminimonas profundi]|uniref:NAD(P)/FAD-dependent oxidoreductase n=1 Tax=Lacisediminimonas profundi TaxID=2603856 RepID=UPI00124B3280|nr:FAD-dependent oxidoreductase [Lacisediminimonas profundi]